MTQPCSFVRDGDVWACTTCSRRVRSSAGRVPTAICRGPRGLGDMVADGLSAVGITKERVQAVASAVGVKDCGCRGRQQKMNELGHKYLGLPEGHDPGEAAPELP